MAEAARVLDYEKYQYGTAAPARELIPEEAPQPAQSPQTQERIRQRERQRAKTAQTGASNPSLFAITGTVLIAMMMLLVLLAQTTYSSAANEAARLNAQLSELNEQHRRLEITFESVIDMKEVERYARDVLGMARPSSAQTGLISAAVIDRGEVLAPPQRDSFSEFRDFISSLLQHFR